MRRHVQIVAGALLVALAATATVPLAAAQTGKARTTGTPKVTVIASGLNSPKHLLYTSAGVYVAESGTGGSTCVSGPNVEGTGTTQYCEGATGAIALISARHVKVIDGKLPSVVEQDSGEVAGPAAVAVSQTGQISVVFQDELVTSSGANSLPAPASTTFGTFEISRRVVAEVAKFAAAHPQDKATFGGTPGETPYDSDPYDVTPYQGGYALTDAAANDLLRITKTGKISVLAHFPTQAETAPAGTLGPAPVTIDAQAVPTSVVVGPDGALYVGLLRGIPDQPGTAEIYRVTPGHAPTVWATGLTAVTAIAFDPEGRLLATEYSTGGILAPSTVPGALVRISANGKKLTTVPVSGLSAPSGVAVAPDGDVYVADHGVSPGTAKPSGEVLKITGLS
ncbi:MAG: ScyD/ScyE family protein [Solirubrobacteraceae bacterium]